jgi:hypothetical protein
MTEQEGYNPEESKESADQNTEAREVGSQNIERTFLISRLPENLDDYEHHEVKEGVYTTDIITDRNFVVKQDKSGFSREIQPRRITGDYDHDRAIRQGIDEEEFEDIWTCPDVQKKAIRTRYDIPYEDPNLGEITIHLDIFKEPLNNKGAVMASVDFASKEESGSFTSPDWFTEEMTEEMAEDKEVGVSIFSGTLIPQRAIRGEALGRLKQSDYYTKPEEVQSVIYGKDFDWAQEDQRIRDFREQVEAEKALMESRESLDFSELKKGDVFLFETMEEIKFGAKKYLDRLEGRIGALQEVDPAREKMTELLSRGRVLLEYADLKPIGDGERQKDFDNLRDVVDEYVEFFEDQDIDGRYRVEVTGKRKPYFFVKIDSDRRGEDGLTARIAKNDFQLDDLSSMLGSVYFENVKEESSPRKGFGMPVSRVGRVYYKSEK